MFGLLLNFVIIKIIKSNGETIAFKAKKVESNDAMIIGMASTYFLPFITRASDITVGITIICPPSAPMRQIGAFPERRMSGSS